jgi:hypothetical protein
MSGVTTLVDTSLYESPMREVAAGLLLLVGGLSAVRGTRRLFRGLGQAVPLEVVRGLRGWVIAIAAAAFAAGILSAQTGFIAFGLVFLAEELYETGIVAVIIRRAARHDEPRRPGGKIARAFSLNIEGLYRLVQANRRGD